MNDFWHTLFSKDENLEAWQMALRAVLIFFFALLLIRLSGRRSFGIKSPFDTIIVILLGTLLGRVVIGASAFFPTASAALSIVVTHRILGYLAAKSKTVSRLVEGKKIILFNDDRFIEKNLLKTMTTKEDVMQSMREMLQSEDLSAISKVYIEPTGKISIVKK